MFAVFIPMGPRTNNRYSWENSPTITHTNFSKMTNLLWWIEPFQRNQEGSTLNLKPWEKFPSIFEFRRGTLYTLLMPPQNIEPSCSLLLLPPLDLLCFKLVIQFPSCFTMGEEDLWVKNLSVYVNYVSCKYFVSRKGRFHLGVILFLN